MESKQHTQEERKDIILFKNVSYLDKANFFEYLSVMVDG